MQYETIKPYIEKKLVSEQVHPEDPNVRIFNYTQSCQFAGAWDDVTRQCRGLIMNVITGEILARPFPKFFNYQEHVAKGWPLPEGKPIVSEKLDGSLGILYWINGQPWIATRGSFMSDQAKWATEYFRTYAERTGLTDDGLTHLFEIIYPANRIVVAYDYSDLVYLTSIDKNTGKASPIEYPFRKAKQFEIDDVENLAKMDEPNSEGFVLYYPEANTRMKIKFPEYVRLHRIVTGVSEISIWEMLRDGAGLNSLLEKVPDEFFKWVQDVENRLRAEHAKLWGQAQMAVQMVGGKSTRKEQAQWIMANAKQVAGVAFSLLDGKEKEASLAVWRMIRPRGQSAFKTDIDL